MLTESDVTVGETKSYACFEGVRATAPRPFDIVGWTDDMPRLLTIESLLIGKAAVRRERKRLRPVADDYIKSCRAGGRKRALIVETGYGVVANSRKRWPQQCGGICRRRKNCGANGSRTFVSRPDESVARHCDYSLGASPVGDAMLALRIAKRLQRKDSLAAGKSLYDFQFGRDHNQVGRHPA